MVKAVRDHQGVALEKVLFAVVGEDARRAFEQALE
jgi:hypothetical protein